MRSNGLGLKRMWWVASVGAGLVVSGCGSGEATPAEPSRTDAMKVARSAVEVGSGPDFTVTSVKAPHSVLPQNGFTASITACNKGSVAEQALVNLVLSSDAALSGDDVSIGGLDTGYLEPGRCITRDVPASAFAPEGTYHLLAVADPSDSTDETSEQNNTHDAGLFGVGFLPDIAVTAVTGPASAQGGAPFAASVTVCNQGTMAGEASVNVHLSSDADVTMSDPWAGNVSAGFLEPGQCATLNVDASAQVPSEGAYHLGAIAHFFGGASEFDLGNNALAGGLMGVGLQPDFVVSAPQVPASVLPGESFLSSVTVCNQGTVGGDTDVELFLVQDAQEQPSGPNAAWFSAGYIEAGQCVSQQVPVSSMSGQQGTRYLRAITDSAGFRSELIESNNSGLSAPIGIGFGSDLVVSAVSAPANLLPGESFVSSVTVCNQGTMGDSAEVDLFFVSGPDDQPSQAGSGYFFGFLDAGQCVTQDVQVYGTAQEGTWYLRAFADRAGLRYELNESNNTRDTSAVRVGY